MRRCGTIRTLAGWNLLEGTNEEDVVESSAATGATGASREERFRRGQDGPEKLEGNTDKLTNRLNGQSVVRAEKSIVANLHETGGKHVLEEAPDELDSIKRHRAPLAGFLVLVSKDDGVIVVADDTVVGDGNAEYVTGQIPEGSLAVTDGLAVHDPVSRPDGRIDIVKKSCSVERIAELGLEDTRKRPGMNEEILAGRQP
jgi:hypothetical protein